MIGFTVCSHLYRDSCVVATFVELTKLGGCAEHKPDAVERTPGRAAVLEDDLPHSNMISGESLFLRKVVSIRVVVKVRL